MTTKNKPVVARSSRRGTKKKRKPQHLKLDALGLLWHISQTLNSDSTFNRPSEQTGDQFGVHRSTINRLVDELEERDQITVKRGKDRATGKPLVNVIRLTARAQIKSGIPRAPVHMDDVIDKKRVNPTETPEHKTACTSAHHTVNHYTPQLNSTEYKSRDIGSKTNQCAPVHVAPSSKSEPPSPDDLFLASLKKNGAR